ncbi:MAG: hydroxymethylbilane synthase [Deferribacteraceae bacterium]|jgi:hydroxymethylbilane synthase|nr:hydroxymethylbilane synthase [Deferribacteraceae bacterium]
MTVTIATRGSELALWQANHIKDMIEREHPEVKVSLNVIKTTGDKILDVPLATIGGKGLFVKEIEDALLAGKADIAVHSMKDVPAIIPQELEFYVNPKGEEPNDAFLSVKYNNIKELPKGSVVGTSSLRRKLQLMQIRSDLAIKDLRGNVNTRIRKLTEGEYDAVILAKAGLVRLGLTQHIKETLPVNVMIPAACQGVLGVEVRKDDDRAKKLLDFLKDKETSLKVAAERAFLQILEGGCQAPIACHAVISGDNLCICGYLSDLDGSGVIKETVSGNAENASDLGIALAKKILDTGGDQILRKIYKN